MVETSHQMYGWSSCGLGKLLLVEMLGSACSEAQADTGYSRGSFCQEIGIILEKKQCRPWAEKRKLKADEIFVGLQ